MFPGFGKQSIVIGSAPHCDIVLQGPGVAPEHARVTHQGGGRLVLGDNNTGTVVANGQPLPPGGQAPFDFRTTFACAGVAVPLNHPALVLMLMSQGQQAAPPGQLIIGRDAARASLVIQHPSVSSQHAIVMLDRMMVVDQNSTSGTWVGPSRIAPGTPTPLDPNGVVAFGPVPVPVPVLGQVMHGLAGGTGPAVAPGGVPGGAPGAMPPGVMSGGHPSMPSNPSLGGGYGTAQPFKKAQTVLGRLPMGGGGEESIRIGRTPDNQIVVEHPQVSSKHAVLLRRGGQLFLQDLRSANGTFVKGRRLAPGEMVPVENGEKVMIGPRPLIIQLEGDQAQVVSPDVQGDWGNRPLYEIEAWGLTLEVPDRDNPGTMKRLLNEVSFKALPGDMIALMGPSGAGKTTLLMCLNGYKPPTAGIVRVNGQDLYEIYDALRGSIGYVPQDDIVHPELTVFEAVKYSARFRLPPDYSEDEIDQRVMKTLADLGLDSLAHLQIGKPEKKVLSGGQRKRVNIALELVTDPVILFLDEPTSGLAADDTTSLITLLSGVARSTGKTIIMTIHQPAKDEYERFNLALIMGYGGFPIFYGPTKGDSYRFFGSWKEKMGKTNDVDNPRDLFDMIRLRETAVFDQMRAQNPNVSRTEARKVAVLGWQQEFQQTETFRRMYSGPRTVGQGQSQRGIPDSGTKTTGQMRLLLSRYFKVKMRDVGGTAIMLLQAPIIGFLLAFVFGGQDAGLPFWCIGALQELKKKAAGQATGNLDTVLASMQPTKDHAAAAFFLVVSAIWFGTSNAAREIVAERAIYLRERMVNLGLVNYVMSKFLLLSFFCVIQCTVLLAIVYFALGFHGGGLAFGLDLAYLTTVAVCAVALGLTISTSVESSEAAMALTPIALIPQVVLGGMIVPMTTNSWLRIPMLLVPARWGFQGVATQERIAIADDQAWILNLNNPGLNSPDDFVTAGRFQCAKAQLASDSLNGAWGFTQYEQVWVPFVALGAMSLVLMVMLLFLLKRRDPV